MRVVLSGGGTGGHIYPAVAIARQCQRELPDSEFLYIGTTKGLESKLVPKEQIPFQSIHITGFRRKLSFENMKTVIRFLKGVNRAKKLLREFKPDVVIGTGGYVCGPVVYAAAKLGIPTIVHEQNAIPGLTNKFLSRYTNTVATSFKESDTLFAQAKHVLYTGNPRATAVFHANRKKGYEALGIPYDRKLVLIFGGSRGAKAINQAMVQMAPQLERLPHVYFVYVTGEGYYQDTVEQIQHTAPEALSNGRLQVLPYIHNMPDVLAATSLMIGRSGASSLAEMTALGIPSILIPSPNVTNNHQEANARSLERAEACEVVLERELDGVTLFSRVQAIINDEKRWTRMSNAARSLGQPDAAERIVQEMLRLTGLK